MRELDAALLAVAVALGIALAAAVIDPELVYVGGISTDAVGLVYGGGFSTGALRAGYSGGFSTSARKLVYGGGFSTGALRLSYVLPCFITVNNSWYALKLVARTVSGEPLTVTAKVNGTSYTVPGSLLLNWTRSEEIDAYADPIAYVEFQQTVGGYALREVRGVENGRAAWPVFSVHTVEAVYAQPGEQPPEQPPPSPQQPVEQPPAREEGEPIWARVWAWLAYVWEELLKSLKRWLWWLLLLLAAGIAAVYLWRRRRGFVLIIEVKRV